MSHLQYHVTEYDDDIHRRNYTVVVTCGVRKNAARRAILFSRSEIKLSDDDHALFAT